MLAEATARSRAAVGERSAALEKKVLGGTQASDDVTEKLRACSRRDAELQAELRIAAEAVTAAEVGATQERDRRAEAANELAEISRRLGERCARARRRRQRLGRPRA